MPTIVWVLIWVAAIGIVAFVTIRVVRASASGPGDFDRLRHSATAEADLRSHSHGLNGFGVLKAASPARRRLTAQAP